MLPRRTSVSAMVIISLVTVTTLLLGSYVAIYFLNVRSRELADVRKSLVLDADQIAISLALPIWNFDRPQIDKVAESMMRDSTLTGLRILSADGKSLLAARRRNAQWGVEAAEPAGPESSVPGVWAEKRIITLPDQTLARVELYATTRFVESRLRRTLVWTVVNILGLDLVLILSLYLLMRVWVFKPLQAIKAFAAAVSAGERPDEDLRFRGELDDLRASMEQMVGQLESRYAQLQAEIAERKRAEELARQQQQQLVQADKMSSLGMMVSGVAHEINNPNNLIMLNADLLETFWKHLLPVLRRHAEQNPGWTLANIPYGKAEGKIETLLAGLSGGSQRIKRIVQNLKDFARIDGGNISQPVDVNKVVEASAAIVENMLRKSTDHFSFQAGEELPRVRGNFQKLEQVLINLLANACQALPGRDKAIRVSTSFDQSSQSVILRVEDQGQGIPKDLMAKVADPFFTTKRETGGTGLGLSVSYGIIQEHKGEIRMDSEIDRGTTIEIRLPAWRDLKPVLET